MFSIYVDTSSELFMREIRRGGNIRCDTHISVDSEDFPDKFFKDFPVIVLSWWIEGYVQMLEGNRVVKNSFMDGPFEFTTQKLEDVIRLDRYERKLAGNRRIGSTIEVSLQEYRNELIRVSQQLVGVLERCDVSGVDFETLKAERTRIAEHSIDGAF